ncbi:uncharacterized protein EI97DRAFT_442113 [Westerdykella ornata]|uniref:Uncharacterized protein n=1 Tax=Westerdykella ornata TaxID=318751 RepID=A0A6A6JM52_WESOR|nr:uncharacterized protein EI97DRAFT_442113 [Westerdykella ornata]KAF2276736.1 hypothetical protein EI97DRAFT_442113 [Westerdykella ornata]
MDPRIIRRSKTRCQSSFQYYPGVVLTLPEPPRPPPPQQLLSTHHCSVPLHHATPGFTRRGKRTPTSYTVSLLTRGLGSPRLYRVHTQTTIFPTHHGCTPCGRPKDTLLQGPPYTLFLRGFVTGAFDAIHLPAQPQQANYWAAVQRAVPSTRRLGAAGLQPPPPWVPTLTVLCLDSIATY